MFKWYLICGVSSRGTSWVEILFFFGSSSRPLCKEWRGWLGRVMNYRGAEWCWGEAMCTSWWLTRPALLAQPPPMKSKLGGAWRNISLPVEPAFVSLFQKNEKYLHSLSKLHRFDPWKFGAVNNIKLSIALLLIFDQFDSLQIDAIGGASIELSNSLDPW